MESPGAALKANVVSIQRARKSFKRSAPKKLAKEDREIASQNFEHCVSVGTGVVDGSSLIGAEEAVQGHFKEENNNDTGATGPRGAETVRDVYDFEDEDGIDVTDVLEDMEENDFESISSDEARALFQKMPLQVQPHRIHKNLKTMQYECPYCSFTSLYYSAVSNHTLIHTGEKPYQCHLCSYQARQRGHILIHMRIHSGKKPFKCSQCSYSTIQRNHLRVHMQVHSQDRPFQCPGCPYRSKHLSVLQMHVRKFQHNRTFHCKECDYTTARKHNLIQHITMHTGSKPYKCNTCSYASSQKGHLNVHMRSHTGEKPYKCHECPFASAVPKSLREHTGMHQGRRSHKCPHCSFSTSQSFSLRKHVALHIAEVEKFKCGKCSYSCSVKEDFLAHCAIHKPSSYSCPSCNFATPVKHQYATHLMSHVRMDDIIPNGVPTADDRALNPPHDHQAESGKYPMSKMIAVQEKLPKSSLPRQNVICGKRGFRKNNGLNVKLNSGFFTVGEDKPSPTKIEIQHNAGSDSQSSPPTPVSLAQSFVEDQPSLIIKTKRTFVCLYCDLKLQTQEDWVSHEMRHFNSWPQISF